MFHFKSWLMVAPSNLALVTNSRGLGFYKSKVHLILRGADCAEMKFLRREEGQKIGK